MKLTILILLVSLIYLAYRHVVLIKRLNKINAVLISIEEGNISRKFLAKGNRVIEALCIRLNDLMDRYISLHHRRNYLEELRKKMITDISHDIRTPLTSLLGYVEALSRDTALNEQERLKYLAIVNEKGTALYEMMDEFFELTKLDEQQELKLEKMDISEKVRQLLGTFYYEITRENIKLELNLPEEPVYVLGEMKCVERVLMNLVSNAIRYGKAGGVIGVNIRSGRDKAWVEVWDKGMGIEEKDMPFLFERLYTAESSRNFSLRGSGLGLSIVKELVARMKGEVAVTSLPNEKTVFTFSLGRAE